MTPPPEIVAGHRQGRDHRIFNHVKENPVPDSGHQIVPEMERVLKKESKP
jgi:hypothetical protein